MWLSAGILGWADIEQAMKAASPSHKTGSARHTAGSLITTMLPIKAGRLESRHAAHSLTRVR